MFAMGYTITIGERVLREYDEYDECAYGVDDLKLSEAPAFPGDPEQHANNRSTSYSAWDDFCQKVRLWDLFYGEPRTGLFRNHPGVARITPDVNAAIQAALVSYRAKAARPPGWHDDGSLDYDLARIEWLAWWCDWAVKNCKRPIIENG